LVLRGRLRAPDRADRTDQDQRRSELLLRRCPGEQTPPAACGVGRQPDRCFVRLLRVVVMDVDDVVLSLGGSLSACYQTVPTRSRIAALNCEYSAGVAQSPLETKWRSP